MVTVSKVKSQNTRLLSENEENSEAYMQKAS